MPETTGFTHEQYTNEPTMTGQVLPVEPENENWTPWTPDQCHKAAILAGDVALRDKVLDVAQTNGVSDPEGLWQDTLIRSVAASVGSQVDLLEIASEIANPPKNKPDPNELLVDEFLDSEVVQDGFEQSTVDHVAILKILRRLPPHIREILFERFYQDDTAANIGARRGLTGKNAGSKIRPALARAEVAFRGQGFVLYLTYLDRVYNRPDYGETKPPAGASGVGKK